MAGGDVLSAIEYWDKQLNETTNTAPRSNLRTLFGISLLDFERSKTYRLRLEHIEKAFHLFEKVEPVNRQTVLIHDFSEELNPPTSKTHI